jgi:hypothetical protein
MNERIWRGQWWLPSKEDRAVGGDLRLAADEFELTLDGELPVDKVALRGASGAITDLFKLTTEPVILGETRTGERLTLLDCEGVVAQIPGGRARVTSWSPKSALLGDHFLTAPGAVFSRVDCEFDYLADWTGQHHVPHSFIHDEETGEFGVAMQGERRVLAKGSIDGAEVELAMVPSWVVGTKGEINMHASFNYTLQDPIDSSLVLDKWVIPTRDLVSFATMRPNKILRTILHYRRDDQDARVELLLQLVDLERPNRDERELLSEDMLFDLKGMPEDFETTLKRWLVLHERYRAVFLLMLGVGYAPFIFDDQAFLAVAQATEVFHRIAVGGTPLSKEEHARRVEAIAQAVADETISKWAMEILEKSNYLKLRERLEALVNELGELGQQIVGGDVPTFVKRVKVTRDYLTHREVKRSSVLEDFPRYWHTRALLWILRAWILNQLGFSKEETDQRISMNLRFKSFQRNFAKDGLEPNP